VVNEAFTFTEFFCASVEELFDPNFYLYSVGDENACFCGNPCHQMNGT